MARQRAANHQPPPPASPQQHQQQQRHQHERRRRQQQQQNTNIQMTPSLWKRQRSRKTASTIAAWLLDIRVMSALIVAGCGLWFFAVTTTFHHHQQHQADHHRSGGGTGDTPTTTMMKEYAKRQQQQQQLIIGRRNATAAKAWTRPPHEGQFGGFGDPADVLKNAGGAGGAGVANHHAAVPVPAPSAAGGATRWNPLPTFQNPHGGGFIHMGKTGGSSLSVLLRNGCHSWLAHPCRNITDQRETIASLLVESYYHVPDFAFLQQSKHDFLIITLRDPYDRTISSFTYEHLANRQARNEEIAKMGRYVEAYRCFPTLETFVSYLDGNVSDFVYPYRKNIARADVVGCHNFTRAAFDGRIRLFNHFFFSYQRIRSFLENNQENPDEDIIYVTRQEHLWDDWVSLNHILAREYEKYQQHEEEMDAVVATAKTHKIYIPENTTQRQIRNQTHLEQMNLLPVRRTLSANGRAILCRALQKEYDAFYWFLRRAKNISPEDVAASIKLTRKRCGSLVTLPEVDTADTATI